MSFKHGVTHSFIRSFALWLSRSFRFHPFIFHSFCLTLYLVVCKDVSESTNVCVHTTTHADVLAFVRSSVCLFVHLHTSLPHFVATPLLSTIYIASYKRPPVANDNGQNGPTLPSTPPARRSILLPLPLSICSSHWHATRWSPFPSPSPSSTSFLCIVRSLLFAAPFEKDIAPLDLFILPIVRSSSFLLRPFHPLSLIQNGCSSSSSSSSSFVSPLQQRSS